MNLRLVTGRERKKGGEPCQVSYYFTHSSVLMCPQLVPKGTRTLRHPSKVYDDDDDDDDDDQVIYSPSVAHSTFTCPLIHPFVCSFVLRSSFRSFIR